jgi:glutathione synthase/RimK-type ligase-like ATP-grasp enzyme
MPRIAFATAAAWPDLSASDRLLAELLRSRGHDVAPLIWSDPVDATFDAILIRSTWDYHERQRAFVTWVEAMERVRPVWNSASLIQWNVHKSYLAELEARGVPIVPTLFVEEGVVGAALFDTLQTDRIIVKPVVSASAHGLRLLERGEELRVTAGALVQPFLDEISDGERSAIVIDGNLTHVVNKRPAEGAFLVQRERGGTAILEAISDESRRFADAVVNALPERPLYARVDFVITRRGPLLMEAELIEPELFLDLFPPSAGALADAIERRLPRKRTED